jgi:Lysozyme like domain
MSKLRHKVMATVVAVIAILFGFGDFAVANTVIGLHKAVDKVSEKCVIIYDISNLRNLTSLSDSQLVAVLKAVGFKGKALKQAWAVAKKETHGNPLSYNHNVRTGDNSYGLFQINMIGNMGAERRQAYGLASNAQLFDPITNAQIAYQISKGGTNWSPWHGITQNTQQWIKMFPASV